MRLRGPQNRSELFNSGTNLFYNKTVKNDETFHNIENELTDYRDSH